MFERKYKWRRQILHATPFKSFHNNDIYRIHIFTSRAAAESNSTVGSSFSEEEEEDHCLLNLGFYGICDMFNLKT